jgi:hypothetical protein
MKQDRLLLTILFSIFFLMTGLFLGCGEQEQEKPVTGQDVKEETKEAVETTMAYTQAKKEQIQKALAAKVADYEEQLQRLRDQGEELTAEGKKALDDQVAALQKRKEAFEQKITKLKTSSGKAWEDLKAGIDAAAEDLDRALDEAISRYTSPS